MADKKLETILFQAPEFRGSRPNTVSMRAIYRYFSERKAEQLADNKKARGEHVRYTMGVDYVFARKIIARLLRLHIIPVPGYVHGARGAKWMFDSWGNQVAVTLLRLGVSRMSLSRWLKKYEDFPHSFVVVGACTKQ